MKIEQKDESSDCSTTIEQDSDCETSQPRDACILDESSYLERFFFTWSFPFIQMAKNQKVEMKDLGSLREIDDIEIKLNEMKKQYGAQETKNLISALFQTFKWEYATSFSIGCIQELDIAKPFMMQKTIEFIQ